MATTYTWIGQPGTAASASVTTDWSPTGSPQAGDTGIITDNGTILLGDGILQANTIFEGNGLLVFTGDSLVNHGTPSLDSATLITTAAGLVVAQSSTIDANGNFVNEGSILADGAAGSSLTINIGATVLNGTTLPGYFYNPSVIQADAGNTLTIAIGTTSELFNTGSIVADGGTVKITVNPSAIAGGDGPVRGFEDIEGGGTLETAAYYPASDGNNGTHSEIDFVDSAAGNTLKIDNVGSFGGVILGFAAGDTIDLGTLLAVGTVTYDLATGFLGLEAANGTTLATLLLSSTGTGFATGTFAVANGSADGLSFGVGADGDTVLTTSLTQLNTSNTSGAWQSPTSWAGGVIPGTNAASASIGVGATAPFTLTTGGAAVSVGGFGIDSPLATLQITSDTTLTNASNTGSASDYFGALDIATGATLTAGAIQLYAPGTSFTLAAGATADLAGRLNTDLAPAGGVWAQQPGQNPFAFSVSAGTAEVDGALLAGPTANTRGGSTSIGYESGGVPAVVIVNPGAVVTDTHTIMGSDPTSAGTLTIDDATWTDFIDTHDTFNSRGNLNVGYDDVALNTPAGTPPPQDVAPAVVTIENNSVVTEQEGAQIADTEDSAGEVTVETGAVWNIGTPGTGYGLGLGYGENASGTLSVLNGGTVAIYGGGTYLSNGTSFPATGGIGIGKSAGASGTIVVSGSGSELSSLNGAAVGQSGQGLLSILNGGTVLISAGGVSAGSTAGASSSGTISVGGSGTPAAFNFTAAAGGLTIGSGSRGTLTVSDSGTINLNGTGGLIVGSGVGSFGTMTVGGTATSAMVSLGTAGVTVGNSGTGFATVNSLGTIALTGTAGISIGQNFGAIGSLTIDGGSVTESASSSGVGVGSNSGAANSILVENNGTMALAGGWLTIGVNSGANGGVTIQGSGSSVQMSGTAGVTVGLNSGSNGTLSVTGGGTLAVAGTGAINVALNGGSTGQAIVSGGLVTLAASTQGIFVGSNGSGTLTVENNGTVTDGAVLDLGNGNGKALITLSGGAISAASANVGVFGSSSGVVNVTSGTLTTTGAVILGVNGSSTGTVTITGSGSSLMTGGVAEVGAAGSGTLAAQNNAKLSVANLGVGGTATQPQGNATNRASVATGAEIAIAGGLAVWAGSTLSVDSTSGIDIGSSGVYVTGAINLENGHTILGSGVIAAPVVNNGVIDASGSAVPGPTNFNGLEIQGAITGTGALQIGAGGILRLDAAAPAGQTIQFGSGSELILNVPGGTLTNTINGLSDGDRIELKLGSGVTITNAAGAGVGTVTVSTTSGSFVLTNVNFASGSGTGFYWGTDANTGDQYIQVATPSVNWTGSAGDKLYSDGGNWSGGLAPNATDAVNLVSNPGTVSGTGSALSLSIGGYDVINSGTWTLAGETLTVAGSPSPPYLPYGVGFYANTVLNGGMLNASGGGANIGNLNGVTVTAEGGANVTTLDDNVGTNSGQSGSLVLTGAGTTWTEPAGPAVNGNTPGYITVGGYGGVGNGLAGPAGFLTVTGGAALNTGGSATLGGGSGSTGIGTVSAGGIWTIANGLQVGSGGTGTLAVSGGTVNATGYVGIGQNSGAEGNVAVSNSGIFNAGSALTVGYLGTGTLTVSTGTVATTGALDLGGALGAFGFVSLTNGGITAPGGMQIGSGGNGLMTVSTGGLLKFGGTYNPVGGGGATDATLVVVNGGTVESTQAPGSTTIMQIANSGATSNLDGSTGTVIVAGSGSLLNLNGNGIAVGDGGNGALEVYSGATADAGVLNSNAASALSAGVSAGSDGLIIVSGTGSSDATLNLGGYVGLGQGGDANLTVNGGGLVNITNAPTNGTGLGIGVGNSGNATNIGGLGEADVTAGGTLSDQGGITVGGDGASGVLNVTGLVSTVTGLTVGAATNIGGTIYGGTGSVNIGAGGTVSVTEAPQTSNYVLTIGNTTTAVTGPAAEASGAVTVSGAGALLTTNNNPMAIGREANGVLTVSQGGTVIVGTQNTNLIPAFGVGQYADGSLVLTDPGTEMTSDGRIHWPRGRRDRSDRKSRHAADEQ